MPPPDPTAEDAEARRHARLYSALSKINRALVHLPGRDELFTIVCRALVEGGSFSMAWIGWHDASSARLMPLASCGDDEGFLTRADLIGGVELTSPGPSGTAFRNERPHVCNDALTAPEMAHWRDKIIQTGWLAGAAFPIRLDGVVRGTLTVYARERGFFRDDEVTLLTEAASDVSFGLDNHARDIARRTAEQELRHERDLSDALLRSMPGVFYMYDREGRFLRWNENFETATGYSGAEIARMHPLDFFTPAEQPILAQQIGQAFEFGAAEVEAGFAAKDGSVTPYYFTGVATEIDGQVGLMGVGIDISERIAALHALQELNHTLEMRVADRTSELRAALVRAESADRLKSAFLATMSHELRTPLNSIIGFTGTVLQGLAGPLNPEQSKQLGMVRTSARHLLELINDVLDLSKIEAGQFKVRIEPFEASALLERVVASVAPMADAKSLTVSTSIPSDLPPMLSDRRRVEQIVLNLLQNAIKFTPQGRVSVTAQVVTLPEERASTAARSALQVRIADTGIGIKADDLAVLFQPFQQLDTGLARQHEGTGLGLTICRRLAHLLGGEIDVSSQWEQGSIFTVTLPLSAEAMA